MASAPDVSSELRRRIAYFRNAIASRQLGEDIPNGLQRLTSLAVDSLSGADQTDLLGVIDELVEQARASSYTGQTTSTSGYRASRTKDGFLVTQDQLLVLQEAGMTMPEMAISLGVSRRTVARRMSDFGIGQHRFQPLSDDELDSHVRAITDRNKQIGYKTLVARLKAQGIIIQRDRVRASLKRVDPQAAASRALLRNPVVRRKYEVDGPNALWHIDGNHKLAKWKIYIHGCVDGFSRLVVFLKASANNRASTVRRLFVEATEAHGVPARIRVDKGGENLAMKRAIEEHHGPGRGSAIQGKSVHNVRIESLWPLVRKDVVQPYRDLFERLSQSVDDGGLGLIDLSNVGHLWALRHVFLPRINVELATFAAQRNSQGISTQPGNPTPSALFLRGMLERRASTSRHAVDFWQQQGLRADEEEEDPRRDFCPLSGEQLAQLEASVDPLSRPSDDQHAIVMLKAVLGYLH